MTHTKNILMIICILSYSFMNAQGLYEQINVQNNPSVFPEVLRIDKNQLPIGRFSVPNASASRRANNGWYPIKGEYYCYSETEIAGYIRQEIGADGLLDKRIIVANHPSVYDSTCTVWNRTPYTKGKDLPDTVYCYNRKTDGSYIPEMRTIYSYHYFDHFEADSFYYEIIYHTYKNGKWNNYWKRKIGYHDTLVEHLNRFEEYYGQGNTWKVMRLGHNYVTYDDKGLVDTLYMIRDEGDGKSLRGKAAFTYDEQGRYTQIDYFEKDGNKWVKGDVLSNITWTEWHGFTYSSVIVVGEEWVSPYKRSKIKSQDIDNGYVPFNLLFRQKWWDINGTESNSDTLWTVVDDKLYRNTVFSNIYNEYGDYVEWKNTHYNYPSGEIDSYNTTYHKRTYDDIYGMTEHKRYQMRFIEKEGLDTTIFYEGYKYTEFAPVSIAEHPQQSKQTLSIYPNPVSGVVTISATDEIAQIEIFDVVGRVVASPNPSKGGGLSQTPTGKQTTFDAAILPQGIYIVQARLRDGGAQRGKLVVK